MQHNQIFIFAAGYGKRMLPLTNSTPKPLLEVKGQSMIERILLQLSAQNYTKVTINVGHLGDKIIAKLGSGEQYGVEITYSNEGKNPKETAGGIRFAIENHKLNNIDPIITINSDVVTDFNFSSLNNIAPKSCHLVLVKNPDYHKKGDFGLADGIITCNNTDYTYCGIGVFNPEFILQNHRFNKLGDVIRANIGKENITAEVFHGKWHDIGTAQRLTELEQK